MADEQNAPSNPPAQAAPVPQPAAATITPEQLQAAVDAARAEERTKTQNATWAEARRKYERQPESPKQATPAASAATTESSQSGDFDQQFTQRLAVESLVHGIASHGLSAAQADAIKTLYKAENPNDVAEWVKQKVSDLGFVKTPVPTAQPAQSSATPTPAAAPTPTQPTTAAPAPVGSSSPTALPSDVLRWSKDMRDAYLRSKAPVPHDLHDRRNRGAWREVAKMALEAMSTVQVVPPNK